MNSDALCGKIDTLLRADALDKKLVARSLALLGNTLAHHAEGEVDVRRASELERIGFMLRILANEASDIANAVHERDYRDRLFSSLARVKALSTQDLPSLHDPWADMVARGGSAL